MEKGGSTAKFTFLYLLSLVALAFLSISTGVAVFQIINKSITVVGEALNGTYILSALRWAMASIIVFAPIYFVSVWRINRNLASGALSAAAAVRRWLTYLILLVTSLTMAGYMIGILYAFLEGDLTLKFALKVLTVLIIAGTIFSYYLYDIRRGEEISAKDKKPTIYFYVSAAVLLAVIATGFVLGESPTVTRQKRQDNEVVNNLAQTAQAVESYYLTNQKMPSSLEKLVTDTSYLREESIKNPITGEVFSYQMLTGSQYELCAEFQRSSKEDKNNEYYYYYGEEWLHDAGEECFSRNADVSNSALKPVPVR